MITATREFKMFLVFCITSVLLPHNELIAYFHTSAMLSFYYVSS